MSKQVDERVVSMQFDNKQFERNVSQTMSTLDKLKQSLNLTGAAKGFEDVNSAANRVNMSALGEGVQAVQAKFSAMQIMAVTALSNITNSAVNAGKRIASALTIDPIKTGFSEYETQINAVQTILANTESKGTTITDVNKALDTLNTYADKTIYNFTEMTRNIGTFTAAGVDLDTSVKSIQGIANLAAVSGSTSQQASNAMYQLSQALAAGKVSLMDWNSVVNAGMGGQVFQDALKRTATNMGKDVDGMIKKYGSFRESLTQGEWLTTDVLTKTLEQFTMAAEEGSEEWNNFKKTLMDDGYTAQQAEDILKMANTATNAATKVKTFTQLWDTLKEAAQSGWTQTWEIIVGDFEEAKALLTNISDVIGNLINKSAQARNDLLQGWKDAGGRTMMIESFANVWEGLLSVITPIKEAFDEIFPATTVDQLVGATEAVKNFTEKLKLSDENAAKLKTTFKGVFAVIDIAIDVIKSLVGGAVSLISNLAGIEDGILGVTAAIGDWLMGLRDSAKESNIFATTVDKITTFVSNAITKIKEFGTAVKEGFKTSGLESFAGLLKAIWNVIKEFGSSIGKAIGSLDIGQGLSLVNTGLFGGLLIALQNFVSGNNPLKMLGDFFDNIGEKAGGFMDSITETLDGVRECLQSYQQNLQAGTLQKIATAIGILAAAIFVISTIEPTSLEKSLGAITVLFGELLGSLALFTKIDTANMKGVTKSIPLMIGMSTAILILAVALKKLSDISPEGILKGLVAIGFLMMEISLFLQTYKFDGKLKGTAVGIVILASSMLIFAKAVESLGSMDVTQLGKGIAAIGAILTELTLFTKFTSGATKMVSVGVGMIAIAASMKIFTSVMKDLAGMPVEDIKKSLGAMGGVLAELVIALNLLPKNTVVSGIGLIAVGAALKVLASALADFGAIGGDQVKTALVAMGVALAELAIALNLMNGTLSGSAALIIAAGALAIMAPIMQTLGELTWGEIAKGLIAIAAAFAVIGIAGALLTPLIPSILGLSVAFALFGIAMLGIGAGLALIGVGISTLATSLAVGATAISAGLAVIITGFLELIPLIVQKLAEGIVVFTTTLAELAPTIASSLLQLLLGLLQAFEEYTPKIIESGMNLVLKFIEGVTTYLPKVIDAAITLIVTFIEGLADSISKNSDRLIAAIGKLITSVVNLIFDLLVGAIGPIIEKGGELMSGLVSGIKDKISDVKEGVSEVISEAKDKITEKFEDFKSAGKEVISGFIDGIRDKIESVGSAASEIGKKALNSIKGFLGIESPSKEFIAVGKYSTEGLVVGLKKYSSMVSKASEKVGESMINPMQRAITDLMNYDMDTQPTIRPVVDLSEVKSGAGAINGMLSMSPSVGVLATAGGISAMMNGRIQNGTNHDIISAIKDLKDTVNNSSGDTYNVNGITYDDGSNITSAVKTLVRAAKVGRRI